MATDICVRRLNKELKALQKDPMTAPKITVMPLETNLLEMHYVIEVGNEDDSSPYKGGIYHGKLIFPKEYPLRPPSVIMLTPSGRFQPNRRLCLSMVRSYKSSWVPEVLSTHLLGVPSCLVLACLLACLFVLSFCLFCTLSNSNPSQPSIFIIITVRLSSGIMESHVECQHHFDRSLQFYEWSRTNLGQHSNQSLQEATVGTSLVGVQCAWQNILSIVSRIQGTARSTRARKECIIVIVLIIICARARIFDGRCTTPPPPPTASSSSKIGIARTFGRSSWIVCHFEHRLGVSVLLKHTQKGLGGKYANRK